MPLRDKLPESCTLEHGLSRNFFVARSVVLHEVELSSTFRNGLQQLATPNVAQRITPPATFLAILRKF